MLGYPPQFQRFGCRVQGARLGCARVAWWGFENRRTLPGLLLRSLSSATILGRPYELLYIYIYLHIFTFVLIMVT